jgi:hypothetical protein
MRGIISNVVAAVVICVDTVAGQNTEAQPKAEADQARVYEAFFHQVARSPEASGLVDILLNGDKRMKVHQPSAQEVLGLTDPEARMLRQSASECVDKLVALARTHAELRREAFFRRIESGRVSPQLQAGLDEIETERLRLISDAVETLKSGFGESRFRAMDVFVRSKGAEPRFFPPTGTEIPRAR